MNDLLLNSREIFIVVCRKPIIQCLEITALHCTALISYGSLLFNLSSHVFACYLHVHFYEKGVQAYREAATDEMVTNPH